MATMLFLILALFSTLSGLVGQGSSSESVVDPTQTSLDWYLATSKTAFGSQAWLFGVAPDGSSGRFYSHAGMVGLTDVSRAPNGNLKFRSDPVLDYRYRFDGAINGGRFAGQLSMVDAVSGKSVLFEWKLDGQQINLAAELMRGIPSLRYSSSRFSRETGDLVGGDIEFFASRTGPVGVMVLYQRNWGEPVVMLALSEISRSGDLIRFSAQLPTGPARYSIRLADATHGVLHRDDAEDRSGDEQLQVKRSLLATQPGRR